MGPIEEFFYFFIHFLPNSSTESLLAADFLFFFLLPFGVHIYILPKSSSIGFV